MYTNYNGKNYFIDKLENENDISYNIRRWIICKLEPNNEKEFKEYSKIAKIYTNVKLLGCEYNESIKNLIFGKIPNEFL